LDQGSEASPNFASCVTVTDDVRSVSSDNPDPHRDGPLAGRAAEAVAGAENRVFPVVLAEAAVAPSLALLNSVLAMAPGHQAALRCRATTLARLGRTSEALVAADLAVASAQAAVRATEIKEKDAEFRRTSASASKSAPRTTAVDRDVTRTKSQPFPPAVVAASGVVGLTASSDLAGGCDSGVRNSCGDQRRPSSPNVSIGFMRSSKVNVAVGGLLLTGGGRPDTMVVAKSLVLRGCLHQKMGRRKNAEEDYAQALVLCHKRLNEIGRLESHHVEPNKNSQQPDTAETPGQEHRTHLGGRGRERGATEVRERDADIGHTHLSIHRTESPKGDTKAGCFEESPMGNGGHGAGTGILGDGDRSWGREGRCEVLKLKSLIHHNFATVHMSALLGADTRASFRKVSR